LERVYVWHSIKFLGGQRESESMKMGAKFSLSVSIQSAVVAAFSFFCAFIRVLLLFIYTESEPCSSLSQYSVLLRAGRLGCRDSSPVRGERIFALTSVSRPAVGPIQPPVQWVLGVLSPGVKCGQGVTLTTHPHLVPRSRMSSSYTSSPPKRLRGV
jgi:hypothetical protein